MQAASGQDDLIRVGRLAHLAWDSRLVGHVGLVDFYMCEAHSSTALTLLNLKNRV